MRLDVGLETTQPLVAGLDESATIPARLADEKRETAASKRGEQVEFFRTLSLFVNAACNLQCPHCDLPRKYFRYGAELAPEGWGRLLDKLLPLIRPVVVSVAAMEPLLPNGGQQRTLAALHTAIRHGVTCGLVTNGVYAESFLRQNAGKLEIDFMDVSVDGTKELDDRVRGAGHFDLVDRLLRSAVWKPVVKKLYVSCVLTKWNIQPVALRRFLDWVCDALDEPRLVLLFLYPNQNVDRALWLDDEDLVRCLDLLVERSGSFADLFIELFPPTVPGLARFIEEGVLPAGDELVRDEAGMLWGHVAENLFVRYETKRDFELFHLRISPEGFAIPSQSLERPDYLTGAYGNLVKEPWPLIRDRILQSVGERDRLRLPTPCATRRCSSVCHAENHRCPLLHP
ncbi:MAG: hypothetical protein RMK20_07565 [Verrucomicrobiales bacterium]|nr:hypothetical protein [Verrucomicrobiales bacterium]